MALLHQIQESIIQEGADLGSVLLKLRLLASKLKSDVLEEWVKYESEGYPKDAEVPSYRVVGVSYKGDFSGHFGSVIKNASIPPFLIEKCASDIWTNYKVRESIAAVDDLVKSSDDSGSMGIDASNLILLLQGKIYKEYSCNGISASISHTSLVEIQQAVRSRVLELTLELEKTVPAASSVTLGAPLNEEVNSEKVQQIFQQIIYGGVNIAVAEGHGTNAVVVIEERDKNSFINHLVAAGFPRKDATKLAEIIEAEDPPNTEEPFGQNAKKWISENIKKVAKSARNIGTSAATKVLIEAISKYYGH